MMARKKGPEAVMVALRDEEVAAQEERLRRLCSVPRSIIGGRTPGERARKGDLAHYTDEQGYLQMGVITRVHRAGGWVEVLQGWIMQLGYTDTPRVAAAIGTTDVSLRAIHNIERYVEDPDNATSWRGA